MAADGATPTPVPVPAKGYFWSPREIAVLRAHYPLGGSEACAPLLPGRPVRAIYGKAHDLGLHCKLGGPRRAPYASSPFIDAEIIALYAAGLQRGGRDAFAKRIGRPSWWVGRQAERLGLTRPVLKHAAWTDAELELLETHAHLALGTLYNLFRRRGYSRTRTALAVQAKRQGWSKETTGHYSATGVAQRLGVDGGTVRRWVKLYGLAAKKRGTERGLRNALQGDDNDEWIISAKDLRAWIGRHPTRVDLRKVQDAGWFVAVLTGTLETAL